MSTSATFAELSCTPCRGAIPPLDNEGTRQRLTQLVARKPCGEGRRIERKSWFSNFRETLSFVQKVGDFAETERHQPDFAFGWGHATVSVPTEKIKGLNRNDFIMAARINRLAHTAGSQERSGEGIREAVSRAIGGTQNRIHPDGPESSPRL
jgi:4a-hydroxytetrahydrobiopterin dehydratase